MLAAKTNPPNGRIIEEALVWWEVRYGRGQEFKEGRETNFLDAAGRQNNST
jgi:hypothetical protein